MGHVGLLPQSVHAMGGYKVQGADDAGAERILADARALEEAGAYSIVLEGIPVALARRITESVRIPTIGIGAGPDCDGQVLVCYDLLGMYQSLRPKFVKHFGEIGREIVEATRAYVGEVKSGTFPTSTHSFGAQKQRTAPPEPTGAKAVVEPVPPVYGPASDEP
jgi:3-methyl-2-oxobutanoate hydroxymethyltransferase